MITLFVALYSLFSLRTAVKTSDIKELHVKTVKRGENVTMECSMSKDKNKNNLAWYRQSFGKVPQYFVRLYGQNNYNFVDEFKDSHFSMTVNDQKFDLNINGTREDDGGEYFCGEVEGIIIKFTSGTRLQFEGSNEGSKSSDGKVLYKNQRKGASNDHPNNTNQADDEDVLNYAAVSFAKKPSSSRASRDKSHEDVYAQVKIK
ncbi:novel immune-type receptor 6 isoform X6 [Ictalurus punctatus]|uniref:Novel immune-type receptor 6 isoform X6 n=1 Tax=Ictalurus punctatus TaxID=7998 RepID=A0A2D0PZG5_ICTPU|nr:novel immune-type receptor 6 isoform X6 [Ictalurus punctatus]